MRFFAFDIVSLQKALLKKMSRYKEDFVSQKEDFVSHSPNAIGINYHVMLISAVLWLTPLVNWLSIFDLQAQKQSTPSSLQTESSITGFIAFEMAKKKEPKLESGSAPSEAIELDEVQPSSGVFWM